MRYRICLIATAVGLVSFSSASSAVTCRAGGYDIDASQGYEHDKWIAGEEPGDLRFEYGGFVAVFDGSDDDDGDPSTRDLLAQPEWVAHEVRRYVDQGMFVYAAGFTRPSPWYEHEDTDFLDSQSGVTDGDLDASYKGEGRIWNRGHMATRSLVNRISPEAGCNTHFFFNAVPQYWSLNQGEWLALERYTGALANKYGKAWAMNGPIFLEGEDVETIGESGEIKVPIPHALWKVIVFEADGETFVRAFIFQQPRYSVVKTIMKSNGDKVPMMNYRLCRHTDQEDYDFAPFVSSLSEIEALTGVEFFPDATAVEKTELNDFSSRGIWRVDMRFFPRPCPG